MDKLYQTSLYENHLDLNAKMIEFSGYKMPIHYSAGINKEVEYVRNNVGIFDVSHMGLFNISGPDFIQSVNKLFSSDILLLKKGEAKYTVMCNNEGGIIDDLIIYNHGDSINLIVNCLNIEKDYNWIQENINDNIILRNLSSKYSIIALQGPNSRDILKKNCFKNIELDFLNHKKIKIGNVPIIIARTGYTGELGYEIIVQNNFASDIWNIFIQGGANPCGLACRDILRIEMCYCLYGRDINETATPINACLSWLIDNPSSYFIGKNAIQVQRNKKKMIYFIMKDRGIPRTGYKIFFKNKTVGAVTSGAFSPTLKKGIGLGYINNNFELINIGSEITIEIRSKKNIAKRVKAPFVKNTSLLN